MQKYSQVKFMTLDQVTRISNDNYFRGNNGEGRDYFDQRFDILNRKYELEEKRLEKMLSQRQKEELEFEIETKKENENSFYKVSLWIVGIGPRKRKIDRCHFELGKTNKGLKDLVTENEIVEMKNKAEEILKKCKDLRKKSLSFNRWFNSSSDTESMIIFDENNFEIEL